MVTLPKCEALSHENLASCRLEHQIICLIEILERLYTRYSHSSVFCERCTTSNHDNWHASIAVLAGCNLIWVRYLRSMEAFSKDTMEKPVAEKQEAVVSTNEKKRQAAADETATRLKKPKHTRKKHMDPAVLELRGRFHQCCATNDLATAMEAYNKAIEIGTRIEPQSFYNLLNLCDGLADRGLHVGTPKSSEKVGDSTAAVTTKEVVDVDIDTRKEHAESVKRRMDELRIPLTETAYSALIKILAKTGDFDEAERLIVEAEGVQQCKPKLRMYSSLLQAYCDKGLMKEALGMWLKLSKHSLIATEREYISLMKCARLFGQPAVMDRVLSDLSEDVPVPSKETSRTLVEWFLSPSAILSETQSTDNDIVELLEEIQVPYPHDTANMGPVQTTNSHGWQISEACVVDTKTGILESGCLKGCRLQPVATSASAWTEMKRMNEAIGTKDTLAYALAMEAISHAAYYTVVQGKVGGDNSEFQGGGKGRKKQQQGSLEEHRRRWQDFKTFLGQRYAARKLDVVIDGANVGYYDSNFATAPNHVNYHQIDWIVGHFLREGKNVLLIIHSRHFSPNLMPPQYRDLHRRWKEAGVLYATPRGMNDDWFWLHAALETGAHVLTNDEMRDHHFQMLAPRSFLRWKDRQQIHFGFGPWRGARRLVELRYPEIYSRRIQRIGDGLVVPLPMRGDANRFLDGSHISEDDPPEETYLCIRPKASTLQE